MVIKQNIFVEDLGKCSAGILQTLQLIAIVVFGAID